MWFVVLGACLCCSLWLARETAALTRDLAVLKADVRRFELMVWLKDHWQSSTSVEFQEAVLRDLSEDDIATLRLIYDQDLYGQEYEALVALRVLGSDPTR